MENSKLTTEQQEYLNDYHAWLEQRPEKVSVPFIFHAQLVFITSEGEDEINVHAEYASDINDLFPVQARLIIESMAENLTKAMIETLAKDPKN
jgi:hypothetical protein